MKVITQISRILVGVLFILSGFIKANDTIGFSYKLEEYFEIFHMPFFAHYAVGIAMVICIFEIMVGVALLIGAYSKLNAWLLLLMIIFFTFLTGYSAITNKVTDCGCFGDAIKLKPVQSFMKDLVLLVFITIIFAGHKHIKSIFANKTIQSLALFVAFIVTTFFTIYTYMFLPRIDFLPYKVGNNILEQMVCPVNEKCDSFSMVFIYEKDGKKQEIALDEIGKVDSTYKFIERKDKLVREGYHIPIMDFKLFDAGGVEFTDSLLNGTDYKLILVQKNITESRKNLEMQIANLAEDWQKSGKKFWALTASPLYEVEIYRHENQLAFPYYNMDGTPLKSMVRSNPGLILMKGTVVIKKWGAYNLPTYNIVQKYMK